MDKKEFQKNVKLSCSLGFKGNEKLECQKTMQCNWDKCQAEHQAYHAAMLTDADRKSCENKDWKKQFACQDKITKKKGLLDKMANMTHCEVIKCPQIRKLNEKRIENFKRLSTKNKTAKSSKYVDLEPCRKEHCSKEIEELEKNGDKADNERYSCYEKHNTWKGLTKCLEPSEKLMKKTAKTLNKCSDKHCSAIMDDYLKNLKTRNMKRAKAMTKSKTNTKK